jgi:hypothetical protein
MLGLRHAYAEDRQHRSVDAALSRPRSGRGEAGQQRILENSQIFLSDFRVDGVF